MTTLEYPMPSIPSGYVDPAYTRSRRSLTSPRKRNNLTKMKSTNFLTSDHDDLYKTNSIVDSTIEKKPSSGFLGFLRSPKSRHFWPLSSSNYITSDIASIDERSILATPVPPSTTKSQLPPPTPKFFQVPGTPKEPQLFSRPGSRNKCIDLDCLYLAFEKQIKSASLTVSALPADAILRHSLEVQSKESTSRLSRLRKPSSPKSLDFNWSKKLFLLTPGSILQYTGTGAYDREPEKFLKLDSESLTFATDVIPGKHWVLQVNACRDGVIALPSDRRPSLFAKLAAKARNEVTTMLLVFDGADEMQEFLVSIRSEISRLGGKAIEEHPQPKTAHSEHDDECMSESSSNRLSGTSRPSEDLAASMSTTTSKDQSILDDLRSNSHASFQYRTRNGTPETSPNRSLDLGSRSRSNTMDSNSTPSGSTVDLRSRPESTVFNMELVSQHINMASSPQLTQMNSPKLSIRRTTTPSQPNSPPMLRKFSTGDLTYSSSQGPTEGTRRRTRRKRTTAHATPPLTPESSTLFTPLSTSLPNHTTPSPISQLHKVRPTSMASPPSIPRVGSNDRICILSGLVRGPGQNSMRARSLRRRSLGSLPTTVGPPSHPPPSAPLPKITGGPLYPPPSAPLPQIPGHSPMEVDTTVSGYSTPLSAVHEQHSPSK